MVGLCPFFQMVRYSNGGLKTGLKKLVTDQKCPVFEWSAKSRDFTIGIPDTHTVWYSDESGIQMVTVFHLFQYERDLLLYQFCSLFMLDNI